MTNSTGSATNWFRYTARQFDSDTGLYYYRARYYDPQTGRFLNEDPVGFDASTNFYPYVANLPTTFIDPTGLQHMQGGPWHPPEGVKFACKGSDDCSTLSWKIDQFKATIASHIAWDLANQTTRHANDILQLQNGLDTCIALHQAKCTNKPPCPPIVIPAPSPQRRPWRVPSIPAPVPSTAIPVIVTIGIIAIMIILSPVLI